MRFNSLTLFFSGLSVAILAAAAPSSVGSNNRVPRRTIDPKDIQNSRFPRRTNEPKGIPNIYGRDATANSVKVERDDFLIKNKFKIRDNSVNLAARQSKIDVFFWVELCNSTGSDCTGRIDLINKPIICFQKPFGKTTLKFHRSGYFYLIDFALHTNYILGLCPGLIQTTQIINNPSNGQIVKFETGDGVNYYFTQL